MSELVIAEKADLIAIADAVREKTGSTEQMAIGEIAGMVNSIEAGGGDELVKSIIDRSITEFSNSDLSTVGNYAFNRCSNLTSVNIPACTSLSSHAFAYCTSLTSVNMPACKVIGAYTFSRCYNLKTINFPVCETIYSSAFDMCTGLEIAAFPMCLSVNWNAFAYCSSLTSINLPVCRSLPSAVFSSCRQLEYVNIPSCSYVGNNTFAACYNLKSLHLPKCNKICSYVFANCSSSTALLLTGSSLCQLSGSNSFSKTPIASGTGYIYVPSSLVASYQTATNWAYFSTQISAIEDSEFA